METQLHLGDTILTAVSIDASAMGYAAGVAPGVYFIRGHFVDVPQSQIVLDPYQNEPSLGLDLL